LLSSKRMFHGGLKKKGLLIAVVIQLVASRNFAAMTFETPLSSYTP
jgi:hypothetical protein